MQWRWTTTYFMQILLRVRSIQTIFFLECLAFVQFLQRYKTNIINKQSSINEFFLDCFGFCFGLRNFCNTIWHRVWVEIDTGPQNSASKWNGPDGMFFFWVSLSHAQTKSFMLLFESSPKSQNTCISFLLLAKWSQNVHRKRARDLKMLPE